MKYKKKKKLFLINYRACSLKFFKKLNDKHVLYTLAPKRKKKNEYYKFE